MTSVRLLAPHLTEENHARVLAAAAHKSRRQVEELVAALDPQPPAAAVLRRVASVQPQLTPAHSCLTQGETDCSPAAGEVAHACTSAEGVDGDRGIASVAILGGENAVGAEGGDGTSSRPILPAIDNVARHPPLTSAVLKPVAPELYRLHVTLPASAYEKLGRAQRLLRHALPSGDPAEILERALTLLVDHLERRRFAAVASPRESHGGQRDGRSRHIPAAVRRAVWRRDDGQCAYVGRSGRCRETAFLEFHHLEPHAVGGPATEQNIQLRCRAHNQYEARVYFGADLAREVGLPWGDAWPEESQSNTPLRICAAAG